MFAPVPLRATAAAPLAFSVLHAARRTMATAVQGLPGYNGKTVTLNTGQKLPCIGLGTFQDPDEQEMSVYTALKNGIRHIDTAHKYDCSLESVFIVILIVTGADATRSQLWDRKAGWPGNQTKPHQARGGLHHYETMVQLPPSRRRRACPR